ncbi:hypothetical protein HDU85_000709 [Gaertneriomyces sp. JEL0708]|nr:hypothetical protein HDU85_000709 [Gaertneriomyces sp. JEL0708]
MVKIIFGAGTFTGGEGFVQTVEDVNQWLKLVEELGIKDIDTAQIYGQSEKFLGDAHATERFIVDTKCGAGFLQDTPASKEFIIKSGQESLQKLQTKRVHIYYLHAPERRVPLEEVLAGIDALYKAGAFEKFGLSNFRAAEVEEVIRVAKEHNYVLPSVYQGNYSAIARRQETELFPTLRKHNIAFYAYSPVAGGFLTKTPEQLLQAKGRWDPNTPVGQIYHSLYNKPELLKALQVWGDIAEKSGLSKAELAYRWVAHHSQLNYKNGDGLIVGASTTDQLKASVASVKKGPLSPKIVAEIEEFWKLVEPVSPLDNFNAGKP